MKGLSMRSLNARGFTDNAPQPVAWKLAGAGPYGSDVDVVSLDAYLELAARCANAEATTLMWGRKVIELEGRDPAEMSTEPLAALARSLRLPMAAVLDALSETREHLASESPNVEKRARDAPTPGLMDKED